MERILNTIKVAGDITDIITYVDETHTTNGELGVYSIDFDKIIPLPVDEEGNKVVEEEWIKENWGGAVIDGSGWSIEAMYKEPILVEANGENILEEFTVDRAVISSTAAKSKEEFDDIIDNMIIEECDKTTFSEEFYATGQCLPIFDKLAENYKEKDLEFDFGITMKEDDIVSKHKKQVFKGETINDWYAEIEDMSSVKIIGEVEEEQKVEEE